MSNGLCGSEITSEEYADVISRYRPGIEEIYQSSNLCVSRIDETWVVINFPLSSISEISYSNIGYFRIPKLYTITDTTSMEESGVIRLFNNPVLDYYGNNVIVGIIDTGLDYNHPVFKDRQGKTRVMAIWDQGAEGENPPDEIGFGNVYYQDEINRALESDNPYEMVPGDIEGGHGTFIAGIAAGSTIDGEFTGAAPESDIVMVKLKPAKKYLRNYYLINDEAVAYSETDVMFGVKFLNMMAAKLSKPLVILIGLGTSYGPHTGNTPLGEYLTSVSGRQQTVIVVPAGNEGNERLHYYGSMSGVEMQTVELNVGSGEKGFILELWGNNPDVYTVEFISPYGETIPRIPVGIGGSNEVSFVFDKTRIFVNYQLVESISSKYLASMKFVNPSEGIWRINVYGSQIIHGVYNMWLPMKAFLSGNTYFLKSDPYTTLTSPGVVARVLTVSAYNHYTNSIYINSGRGYTANGNIKPDIAAPGVNVYGPASGGGYTQRSGTSIAAAHVAGCSALLFNWGVNNGEFSYMNSENIKSLFIKGADREESMTYPNRSWGYGKLNIYKVFESLRTQ